MHYKMTVEPWWRKANPKGSGSLPAPRSGHATAIRVFLLILEDLDRHQNLISPSLYHPKNSFPFITV